MFVQYSKLVECFLLPLQRPSNGMRCHQNEYSAEDACYENVLKKQTKNNPDEGEDTELDTEPEMSGGNVM
jgi:hypothetical protein